MKRTPAAAHARNWSGAVCAPGPPITTCRFFGLTPLKHSTTSP
jgi:hypothetical protein